MKNIVLLSVLINTFFVCSQNNVDANNVDVETVIHNFFKAMKDQDTIALKACLMEDVHLFSIHKTKNNQVKLNREDIVGFIEAVGTPKKESWNEKIENLRIESDGLLATAWMDYSFYIDTTFSHCGVNSFQLIFIDEKWKIFEIADTRMVKGCE